MIVPAQQQFAQAAREARARMYAAAMAPRQAPPVQPIVVRMVPNIRAMSDQEAAHNEYIYLSSLAMGCEAVCTSLGIRRNSSDPYTFAKVREIAFQVCHVSGVSYVDLISHRRQADIVRARQFAMWRAKNETLRSYPEIGRRFGGRDHSTAIAAVRKIDKLIAAGMIPQEWLDTRPDWAR